MVVIYTGRFQQAGYLCVRDECAAPQRDVPGCDGKPSPSQDKIAGLKRNRAFDGLPLKISDREHR